MLIGLVLSIFEMSGNLRKSLQTLHVLSRLLCIQSFSLDSLTPSIWGSLYSCAGCIVYIFIQSATPPPSSTKPGRIHNNSTRQLMAIIIDYYNRYAMFCGLLVIALRSIHVQWKIIRAIKHLEQTDQYFRQNFGIIVNDTGRCRWFQFNNVQIPYDSCFSFASGLLPLSCLRCWSSWALQKIWSVWCIFSPITNRAGFSA